MSRFGTLLQHELQIEILEVFSEAQRIGRRRHHLKRKDWLFVGIFELDTGRWVTGRYGHHRALGLCGKCSWPAMPGKSHCFVHKARQNYKLRQEHRQCLRCKQAPLPRKAHCATHQRAHAAATKLRGIQRSARGLCVACGKNPSVGVRCDACKAKRREKRCGS